MFEHCRRAGIKPPRFRLEYGSFILTVWRKKPELDTSQPTQSKAHEHLNNVEHRIVSACSNVPKTAPELLNILGYKTRTGNFKKAIKRILYLGYLEMSAPEKARSKKQQYHLTKKGENYLKRKENNG